MHGFLATLSRLTQERHCRVQSQGEVRIGKPSSNAGRLKSGGTKTWNAGSAHVSGRPLTSPSYPRRPVTPLNQTGRWLTALTLITALGIAVFTTALATPAFAAKQNNHSGSHGKALGKTKHLLLNSGWALNITAAGHACNVSDRSKTATASLTLLAQIKKGTPGGARLEVTDGQLRVGSTLYVVQEGRGRLSMRSDKMVLHVIVQASDGSLLHVILKARLSTPLPSPFDVAEIVPLTLEDPQSKLAGLWFLELTGTLRRTA